MNRIDSPYSGLSPTNSAIVISIMLSVLTGLILALLVHYLGLLSLPIVFFLVVIFPWLFRDTFRLYIWLIVTWPILALYARIPLPAGIPDLSYERVMVIILLIFLILDGFINPKKQLKFGWLTFFASILIVAQVGTSMHVILFGGIGSPSFDVIINSVLVPIGMYWITKNVILSRRHLTGFVYAVIFASLLICFTGLIDQVVGSEKSIFAPPAELGFAEDSFERYMDVPGGRAGGVMGNPGIYGAVLGVGILTSISYVPHASERRTRIFLVASALILLIGVFASYTRQAWLAVALTLFLAQFFIRDMWKKFLPLFTLQLVIIGGILANSSLLDSRVLNPHNVNTRVDLSKLAWKLFLEKPLFGWGAGAMSTIGLQRLGLPSHNTFLSLLVDGGLILFFSFLIVLLYISFRIIQVYRQTEKNSLGRSVLVAMSGFILIFVMSGMARELRYFGYFNTMFWICAGVIDNLAEGYVSKEEEKYDLYGRTSHEMVNEDQ